MELLVIKSMLSAVGLSIGIIGFMVRQMYKKIDNSLSRDQVRLLIDDKLAPIRVRTDGLSVDIKRVEFKLDKILDQLIKLNGRHEK